MDGGWALREVRQFRGWSQRELAARLGVSGGTVSGWETGRRALTVDELDAALDLAGLGLALVQRPGRPDDELVAHLGLSTSERLFLAAGGRGAVNRPGPPLWDALIALARRAEVLLPSEVAARVWVTGGRVPAPWAVRAHPLGLGPLPAHPLLLVRAVDRPDRTGLVPVAVTERRHVWVGSPLALSLDPACRARAADLRLAARLLDERARRDDGLRRRPAHRSPDERREVEDLLHRPELRAVPRLPDGRDSRAWRLDGPVSLRQSLRERGLPTRRAPGRDQAGGGSASRAP
jgi:transcriptional regulator with XRE-family HTH domain